MLLLYQFRCGCFLSAGVTDLRKLLLADGLVFVVVYPGSFQVRFEAVLLKAHNPNEAIVKYCESVGADLLVLGLHTNRILNWVKDIQMIPYCEKNAPCDVKIMGESKLDEEPDKPAAAESAGLGDVVENV